MTIPVGSHPMADFVESCSRCENEVITWVAVLWQREHFAQRAITVQDCEALAYLCLECAQTIGDSVHAAVSHVCEDRAEGDLRIDAMVSG